MRCGKSPGQFKGLQVFLVVNLVNITNHPCLVLSWLHEICTPFLNCCDKNSSSKMNHVVSWQNGGSTYVSKTTVGVCLIEMKKKKILKNDCVRKSGFVWSHYSWPPSRFGSDTFNVHVVAAGSACACNAKLQAFGVDEMGR
jgi:hypothetical protein